MNLKRTKTSRIKYNKSRNKNKSAFEKLLENSKKSVILLNDIISNNNDYQKNNYTYKIIKDCLDNNQTNILNDSSQKNFSSIDNIFKNETKYLHNIPQKENELNNYILNFQGVNNKENKIQNISLNLTKKLSFANNLTKNKIEYSKKFRFSIFNGNTMTQKNKRKSGFSMFNFRRSKLINSNDENQEANNEKKRVKKFLSFLKKNNRNGKKNYRKDSILYNKKVNFSKHELNIEYPKLQKILFKLKIIYFICCIFIILSFIFACIDNEIYNYKSWKFLERKYYLTNYNKTKVFNETIIIDIKNRKISYEENMFRILDGIFSFSACILLIIKFQFKQIQIEKNKNDVIRKNAIYKNNKRLYTESLFDLRIKRDKKRFLFLKLFLLIIFYPPFVNNTIVRKYIFDEEIIIYIYSLNSIFVFVNILKLVIIILYILEFSRHNSIITKKYCQNKIKTNSKFRAKSIFQKYPLITCFIILVILVIIITILKRFFDAFSYSIQYETEEIYPNNPLNEIYFSLSVISHHWFGDYKSITLISKTILYIGSTLGMIILSVWSFYFNSNILELNSYEKKAYMKLLKLRNYENKEHKATNLIKEFLNLRRLYLNFNNISDNGITENYGIHLKMLIKEKFIIVMKLRLELKYFKNEGKIARNYSLPLHDLLNSLEKKMDENNDTCNNQIDKLFEIRNTFSNFIYNNQIIIKNITEIRKNNAFIYEYLKQYYNEYYLQFVTFIKPKLLKSPKKQVFMKQRRSDDYKTNFRLKINPFK